MNNKRKSKETDCHTVAVDLGERSYNIVIGYNLLDRAGELIAPLLPRSKTVIVTDQKLYDSHFHRLRDSLELQKVDCGVIVLDQGEGTKSWHHLEFLVEKLIEEKIERNDPIIAFGGGVIGDLTGFAASILRRGVPYIQIPTTLLAQVDSSVGGKTSINSRQGKNLVGAFYQPILVMSDLSVLETLSPRDFRAGYGEVLKYGLLADKEFFEWLVHQSQSIKKLNPDIMRKIVGRSCEIKAQIASQDEKEKEKRALLNLGHTFGHALETATGYSSKLLHGEAVAIGCRLAFELSKRAGYCTSEDVTRVTDYMKEMDMLLSLDAIKSELPSVDDLIEIMHQDKKSQGGVLKFVLVKGIGQSFVTSKVDLGLVHEVLEDILT